MNPHRRASPKPKPTRLRIAVVTGTRAEFGLLQPVMWAIKRHKRLELLVVAAGSHFLPPARTIREVEAEFKVAARVPMQRASEKRTRAADARAVARGIDGFARAFARLKPDVVVVLGDRIEAFAAASAASIAGIAVGHIHGGDRAEGIADEAMRHAITKLAHVHFAATKKSAARIVRMGEKPEHVHVTGSPAIDGLDKIKPMSDREAARLGDPVAVVLMHPSGLGADKDTLGGIFAAAAARLASKYATGRTDRVLILDPNHDAGRDAITRVYGFADVKHLARRPHLPRPAFLALLKRLARVRGGMLIGNSSAGLIEAAAIGVPVVDFPPRQAGRERGGNTVQSSGVIFGPEAPRSGPVQAVRIAARLSGRLRPSTLFGDGRAGPRIAALLALIDPDNPGLLRKRIAY